jgi:hypothetical protein
MIPASANVYFTARHLAPAVTKLNKEPPQTEFESANNRHSRSPHPTAGRIATARTFTSSWLHVAMGYRLKAERD